MVIKINMAFISCLKVLKFLIKCFLFIPNYFLDYVIFFFTFKGNLSQFKVLKNKKNILCILPYMIIGGAERAFLNIAKGIDQGRFNFHLVTITPADNDLYNEFHSYFQNIIIPVKRIKSQVICNKYFCELINRLNIDIVLINSNSLIGYKYLSQLKSQFKHIKTVDLLHAEEGIGALNELDWVIPHLDIRICISNRLKEYMVKKYKKFEIEEKYIKRLKVIRNGIDIKFYSPNASLKGKFKSRYGISNDAKIISFIGRFSYEKRPLLFVDIARQIIAKSHNYKLKFIMVGDGAEFDEVKCTINRYGINDHFILTGMINDIRELLADTYILLVVSKREGIPFVVLEAMAMKIPVISTDVGAIHEVIENNVNGILVNPENKVVESFTFKILDLLSEDQMYKALVEKTRETIVTKYSLETTDTKYKCVFDELVVKN